MQPPVLDIQARKKITPEEPPHVHFIGLCEPNLTGIIVAHGVSRCGAIGPTSQLNYSRSRGLLTYPSSKVLPDKECSDSPAPPSLRAHLTGVHGAYLRGKLLSKKALRGLLTYT